MQKIYRLTPLCYFVSFIALCLLSFSLRKTSCVTMAPVSQQKLRKNLVKFWERIREVETPVEFARRRRGWFKGTEFVGRFETRLLGNGGGEVTHEKARKVGHRLSLVNLGWSNSELMHHVEYLVPNHLFGED